jgi:hypothetical protein
MCPGSLVVHIDGTVAGCSEDDEADGSAGRDTRATRCAAR